VAHLGLDTFTFGERQFSLPAGIDCDLVLTNAGEGILVTGIARAEMVGTCDRCLDEARLELAAEVDAYYLFHEPDPGVLEQDEEEGPDFELVGADSTIDLNDAVDTALIMEIPYVVLCREDCRGLCPVCGENLNHVDCGHAEKLAAERERDRIASSPFAVLKDLDLD
jgi:uncharacterized protein